MRIKQTVIQRTIALILALVMVLNNNAFALAADTGEEINVAAETSTPETKAPETSAPETQAPETTAPETSAPETQAPETTAPETMAPENITPETTTPETQAPETNKPETTEPETSLSETTVPETEKISETSFQETEALITTLDTSLPETEKNSEAELEIEKPAFETEQIFDTVKVKITAEEGVLPKGTTAEIKKLNYEEDVQDILDTALAEDEKASFDAVMYDVVLHNQEGKTIQPEGKVTIQITGLNMDIPEEYAELIQYQAYRINQDETLTLLKANLDVSEGTVEFDNDHFTAVGIVAEVDIAKFAEYMELLLDDYPDYPYIGNSDSSGIWIQNRENTSEKYIAYCFNKHKGTPRVSSYSAYISDNYYKKEYEDATASQFWEELDTSLSTYTHNNATESTLKMYITNVVYAGYPYEANSSFTYFGTTYTSVKDFAEKALGLSGETADQKIRDATQNAIWYFTDDFDGTSSINKSQPVTTLTGYLVAFAKAQTNPANIMLDLYNPRKDSKQNLLVTRVKVGEIPVPPSQDTKIDVPVYKYEKYQTASGEWITTKTPIQGITFILSKDDDNSFTKESVTGVTGTVTFKDLGSGTYTINETVGATGWKALANGTVRFTVDTDGNLADVNTNYHEYDYEINSKDKEIYIYNGHEGITFNKVDPEGNLLSDARLLLEWIPTASGEAISNTDRRDAIKNSIGDASFYTFNSKTRTYKWYEYAATSASGSSDGTWISSNEDGNVISLPDGVYRLTEVESPNSYGSMGTVGLIIKTENGKQKIYVYQDYDSYGYIILENGTNVISDQTVTILNNYLYAIKISKINTAGEELEGAELILTDENGNEVASWTSAEEYYEVSLMPGSYWLEEKEPPTGYEIAASINFEVDEKGNVSINGEYQDDAWVFMEDKYVEHPVKISKIDIGGNEIPGATLEIRNANNDVVGTWTSAEGQNHEVNLIPGEYILTETIAPSGYEYANPIQFTVDIEGNIYIGGEVQDSVVMQDEYITTSLEVEKNWDDNENQDGIRPNDVTVYLYANGMDTGKSVILNEGNKWSAEFTELRAFDDKGKEIEYTVTENEVSGYIATYTTSENEIELASIDADAADTGKTITITNTHTPEKISIKGTKIWNDENDNDGKRPESVEIILKKAGQEIARKTVTEKDNWSYTFDNLPKYENNGNEIRYTVQEGSIPEGYQSVVNGYNITNNYTPGKVAVQAAKSWLDNDNQDGLRPNEVTVHLYADGEDTGKTVTLNAGNKWIADFEDLDEYKDGKKIVYTITEDAVTGYTTTITTGADEKHFTITNTHTPEKISIKGTKIWNDENDQDGKRPESVEIILKKAGQEIARKMVKEEDDWSYTFDNLPKYENNGNEIRYTVQEGSIPEGYQSVVNGYNITNNYTPGKVAVQAAKSWKDNENQDGLRPNEITVHLYADGEDTGKTVTLNAGNKWIADFEDLDEYKDGKKIVYTITEDAVTGYTTTITTGADEKHFTITNTHTPEKISIKGTKIWNDENDQDGKRPESVEIILKKAGQEIARKMVKEEDDWSYTFDNLPKYENNGNEIRYTVQEGSIPEGYQSVVNGYNITNNYTPGKVAVQAAKSWIDNDNQDGLRPNEITVHLYADGEDTGKTVTLNAGNKWIADFEDLDEYQDGKKIVYTITEDAVTGYTTTITTGADEKHFTITNTHTPERISIKGTKIWNDENDHDGKRPESVEIILKKAGQEIARKTVTEKDNWGYTFDNLPKYENNGTEIRYTVQEGSIPEGYQSVVNGYNITNNYTPGKVAVQAAKSWKDNENQDGLRPNEITVHLYADGEDTGKTVTLNAGNKWIADFEDLDKYKDGKKIVYTITEDAVTGYTTTITTGADEKHFTITNTHTPERISITGTKIWNDENDHDGKRPESVEIILKKAGQEIARKMVKEEDNWSYTFDNLPKYENNGTEIRYTVQEGSIPEGYQSVVNGYNITNNYTPGKVAVQAAKSWLDNDNQDGLRPNEVTVHLYADGEDTGKTVTLNAGNKWIADFEDLDEYQDGQKIVYTITEDAVAGYETTITTGADEKHFTITNTHTPERISITGTKIWNDENDQDGKRPESVEIILKKAGQEIARKTVTEKDNWGYTFDNLPKYENNGSVIRYTVQEGTIPEGYQSVVNGYNITNNYTPGTVAVQAAKSWLDNDNQDGLRPNEVTVHLYADGEDTGKTVTLNAGNKWIADFEDLDEYKDGQKIVYTITEDAVKGYTTTITTGADEKHFTITNTHTPERISITGTKIWNDENDQDGMRPESVEIILKKAGQEIARKMVKEEDDWSYTFDNLPKYENNGSVIRYTVQEGSIPEGYQSVVNGYNITNNYTPGTVAVQVAKSWLDNDNQDGLRPKEVTVHLYADGKDTGETLTLNAGNKWIADFEDLDEYKDGKKIVYTITEDAVTGYTTTITTGADEKHFTITNTHTPVRINVSGTKIWQDRNDKDEKRPEYIIVTLLANDVEYASMKVTEKTGWEWAFENMPKYRKGAEIQYSVIENEVTGYQATVTGNVADGFTITNIEKEIKVEFSKTDIGGSEIKGAKIEVRKDHEKGEVITGWTSGEDGTNPDGSVKTHIVELQPGTYTMIETQEPNGYEKAESITFTVNQDGKITVNGENTDKVTMVDAYKEQPVEISKVDIGGKEIAGAVIEVRKDTEKGEVVTKWRSGEDGTNPDGSVKTHTIKLQPGTYVMIETQEPNGYEKAESITFTVDHLGKITVNGEETGKVTMVDEYCDQTVELSKTDIGGSEIKGAKIEVRKDHEQGEFIDSWISGLDGTNSDGSLKSHTVQLQPGTYVMIEKQEPNGYEKAESITFIVDHLGKVTVNGEETGKVTMVDAYKNHPVEISKVDIGGKEIAGAVIEVRKDTEKGELVTKWKSGEDGTNSDGSVKTHTVELQSGTYVLIETQAPNGYEKAESITFTVDQDGKIVVNDKETEKVTMVDVYADQTVEISKVDIGGKEIAGAAIEVRKDTENGEIVKKWISGEDGTNPDGSVKSHTVELQPGTYVMIEKQEPNGYEKAESITFIVDHLGKVTVNGEETGKVTMVDAYKNHPVEISKVDIGGKEIAGAVIEVRKDTEKGELVTKWKSGEDGTNSDGSVKTHTVELQPGTYVMIEKQAPNGYERAESIVFTVDLDGKVKVSESEVGKVVMVDVYSEHTVRFDKIDLDGKKLPGAKISLLDENGKTIEGPWTTDGKTKEFSLLPGTYTIKETEAPEGYLLAEDIIFTVSKEGVISSDSVTVKEGNLLEMIDVEDAEGNYLKRSKITVEKIVLKDGKEKPVTKESFYFALFTDKKCTERLGDVLTITLENSAKGENAFTRLSKGTYYIAETDQDGKPVDDDYEYTVSIDKEEVILSEENATAKVIVKNSYKTKTDSTSSSSSSSTTAAKTGDNSPIMRYLLLMIIAMMASAFGLYTKKKKKK